MSEIFSIKLVTPSKVFLEANASLVTVPATEGDIGFLANHVNFISSIRPGFISVNLESGDEKVIYISEAMQLYFYLDTYVSLLPKCKIQSPVQYFHSFLTTDFGHSFPRVAPTVGAKCHLMGPVVKASILLKAGS